MATRTKTRATVSGEAVQPPAAYEHDYYGWAVEQASALRGGLLEVLDFKNLAEEIEDLGREQFSKLRSALRVILLHMLKWDHQPERRSRSWAGSIRIQRIDLGDVLDENPSLRRRQDEAVRMAYRYARAKAAIEMNRDERTVPADCPYSLEEILERPFTWPEA